MTKEIFAKLTKQDWENIIYALGIQRDFTINLIELYEQDKNIEKVKETKSALTSILRTLRKLS